MSKKTNHNNKGRSLVEQRLPRLVITGPPGAGKTTAMTTLQREFGDVAQCVHEVATPLIMQLGITPGNKGADFVLESPFQYAMYHMQQLLERVAEDLARITGRKALIIDQARPVQVAHLRGGVREYEKLFDTTLTSDHANYDMVLCLELPGKKIFEQIRKNNPARREDYSRAKWLDYQVRLAWKSHPNFVLIRSGSEWEEKMNLIRREVKKFLNNKRK